MNGSAADPTSKKALFFGSPEVAVVSLRALIDSRHEVVGVVTGPDRPAGRGMKLKPSPVKEAATSLGLPVLQPASLRTPEVHAEMASLGADAFVVVAYGLILPVEVLEMPRLGCVNVHFSLLPRHRGAAPVQWAIIEGDTETGVSIMRMDAGLDTGPVLRTVVERIDPDETAGELTGRLAAIGARALVEVIDELEHLPAQPQPDEGATYAAKLSSEQARIDWSESAVRIKNLVRALQPHPGAWTELNGRRLKVLAAQTTERASEGPPGQVVMVGKSWLGVNTADGVVELLEVQPEGKPRMSAADFARGQRLQGDEVLGSRLQGH